MSATHTWKIPLLPSLSQQASKSHVFGWIHSSSLISLVQLCKKYYIAISDQNAINILKDSKWILKVHKNWLDGLWGIPITKPIQNRAHAIITVDITKTETIQYLHGWCFSPTPRTFLKAIKNGIFLTFGGLNNPKILKSLTPVIATALVNLGQERKNLQ